MPNDNEGNGEADPQDSEPEQPRDPKGRFAPKTRSESHGQTQPSESEYTKLNSLLAKQLGITDKLADYQTKYDPRELFKMLEFMVDNSDQKPSAQGRLPPNEPIAPISPDQSKIELPGVKWNEKPNLTQNKFSASFRISPSDLLKSKDKQ
jgi:hypothetical protein